MPRELPFVTLDVFSSRRFKGNPLAVVTIPHDTTPPLTQLQKQTIAREFNLSETVFVHDHNDESKKNQRNIDIFVPNAEVPFAGHPTIGTAVSLLSAGVTTLVTKAGPISLTETSPGVIQADIPHNVKLHKKTLSDIRDDGDYSCKPGDISSIPEIKDAELSAPPFSIVKGMNFILVPLSSVDILGKVEGSTAQFPADKLLDQGWAEGFLARYYYVQLGRRTANDGVETLSIRTRMIEASFEDPATGSAACSLCSYLALQSEDKADRTVRYEITQGVEMGRDSDIIVEITTQGGNIDTVKLGGTAIQVMRGFVTVE